MIVTAAQVVGSDGVVATEEEVGAKDLVFLFFSLTFFLAGWQARERGRPQPLSALRERERMCSKIKSPAVTLSLPATN